LKAVREYVGNVEVLEKGSARTRLDKAKALKMARTYNAFICSIIRNSTEWTLENGNRTIIATLGITIDGMMRNKIGDIGEERVRTLILHWLIDRGLIAEPLLTKEQVYDKTETRFVLPGNIVMRFASEPDISFVREDDLLAVVEIKGGIDPAGALERYGAATKSFQHSIERSPRCKNFYLGAVYTAELKRRIRDDRLVESDFDIVEILENPEKREEFFKELFHHTLRLM
jgi:hypothetical protein